MGRSKQWSESEDQALRYLFEVEKITKWSQIAQKMVEQYKLPQRNAKQCRQRYQQHLDPSYQVQEWSIQEQQHLRRLHHEIGNKWAIIAQHMPGRTDNCVKNHMYSRLRKAIRKLNKGISKYFKKQLREIRPTVLYKIIEATDEKFRTENKCERIASISTQLKDQLLDFPVQQQVCEVDRDCLKKLVKEIHEFSQIYKRKPKKERRGQSQVHNLLKAPQIDKFKCSDMEDDSQDFGNISVQDEESIHMGEQQKPTSENPQQPIFLPKIKQVIMVSNGSLNLKPEDQLETKKQNLADSSLAVREMLNNAGLLEDGSMQLPILLKQSISDSNISDKNEKFNLGNSIDHRTDLLQLPKVPHKLELQGENKLFKSIN